MNIIYIFQYTNSYKLIKMIKTFAKNINTNCP